MNTHNTAKSYTKCLCELMSFINGVHYDATASFTRDEFLAITADQVAAYLNKKAYGNPSPSPDDRPHHMRAASLAYHKKAISQFMPLRIMAWDDINLRGNPTRSTAVNDVITRVKKYEVRQEGFSSKARRALEWEDFYSLLWLVCHLYATVDLWYYLTAVLCLQWQIIGRIDDVMKLGKGTLLFNTREPAALSVKMNWSKNIRDLVGNVDVMSASSNPSADRHANMLHRHVNMLHQHIGNIKLCRLFKCRVDVMLACQHGNMSASCQHHVTLVSRS